MSRIYSVRESVLFSLRNLFPREGSVVFSLRKHSPRKGSFMFSPRNNIKRKGPFVKMVFSKSIEPGTLFIQPRLHPQDKKALHILFLLYTAVKSTAQRRPGAGQAVSLIIGRKTRAGPRGTVLWFQTTPWPLGRRDQRTVPVVPGRRDRRTVPVVLRQVIWPCLRAFRCVCGSPRGSPPWARRHRSRRSSRRRWRPGGRR